MKINIFDLAALSDASIKKVLRRSETDISELFETVSPIIDDVKKRGDPALIDYTRKFDGADTSDRGLKVSAAEIQAAKDNLDEGVKEVIEYSARNIRKFHKEQMPKEMWFTEVAPGIMAGEKITPITSVGLYVPSGKGSFPSVMLMLGTPAVIAGVREIIVCTPPRSDGSLDPATLFAADICGIKDIYRVGGAQAIAAMAFGTESVPKVVKTLGPGSGYVAAAKRKLFGEIDPGTPAGPSESIILCDEKADPRIAALDLLIEAEHGPDSAALLVTHSQEIVDGVMAEIPDMVEALPDQRKDSARRCFRSTEGL